MHHKINLTRLTIHSDLDEIIDYIYQKHRFYLTQEPKMKRSQIENLVKKLQNELKRESHRSQHQSERRNLEKQPSPNQVMQKPKQPLNIWASTPQNDWSEM